MAHTSPARLLLALFLITTELFAFAAVLGVDLGTEYIKAALVKPGIPLEIVLTKDSRRKELSAVTFKPSRGGPHPDVFPERLYGSDAMALASRFPADVYPNLKALLGLPADSAAVQEYSARHPALRIEPASKRATAAFKSKAFVDQQDPWTVEELLAMQLQSIQRNAEALAGSGTSVKSVVLTVPPFYTVEEKRAVRLAAELAGLKVLSLISDPLAVGLNYATSRTFPNINEGAKPEINMVFDMGAGSTKASVLRFQSRNVKDVGKFNKTVQEVQVLGTGWDRTLGGDELNNLILDDMISQFADTPAAKKAGVELETVQSHGRAVAKMSKEAERLRHILSANSKTSTGFEGLYDEVDFKYQISRTDFEAMAEAHAERVSLVVHAALGMAGLDVSDLDSIILHGGASRTPFVHRQLENIVGDAEKIRTNVNSDESALFGAGFRAAELSPSFRVKEIKISDATGYPAGINWIDATGNEREQSLWQSTSHLGGPGKEVTFDNREDFQLSFYQDDGAVKAETKLLTTTNLTASVEELKEKHSCLDEDIQFKIRMRLASDSGEVEVTTIGVECEAEESEKEGFVDGVKNLFGFGKSKDSKEAKDQQVLDDEDDQTKPPEDVKSTADAEAASSSSAPGAGVKPSGSEESNSGEKTKKLVTVNVAFTLQKSGVPSLTKAEITTMKDRLKAFSSSDRARKLREEALNELEGYTYKVRDLLENEGFIGSSTEEERATLNEKASEISDWIYDDGADAPRDDLQARLKEIQDMAVPIQRRATETHERPALVTDLKDALKQSNEFLGTIRDSIAKYAEWEAAEQASSSAAAEAPSSSSTTTAPHEEASGEFAGLEDDEPKTVTYTEEDLIRERGPVPPLYTEEDLAELNEVVADYSQWLEEMVAKQEGLPPTADPVLLAKDLEAKRKKLDKVGVDLAMKSVKNFEKREKSSSKSKTSRKTNSSKTSTSTAAAEEETESASSSGTMGSATTKVEGAQDVKATLRPQDVENDDSFIRLNPDDYMQFDADNATPEEMEEAMQRMMADLERQQRERQQRERQQRAGEKEKGGHDEL